MNSDKTVSFLCPVNDLESQEISLIACSMRSVELHISSQLWGASIALESDELLSRLRDSVLIVEMPDPPTEHLLRTKGHTLELIDHHQYHLQDGTVLDRRHPLSSIEQVAVRFSCPLTDWQRLVAWNDRGYIWELLAQGVAYKDACAVRKAERQLLDVLRPGKSEWRTRLKEDGLELFIGSGPQSPVVDGCLLPGEAEWNELMWKPELALEQVPVLLFLELKNSQISAFDGYGSIAVLEQLLSCLPARRKSWQGGTEMHGYCGGLLMQESRVEILVERIRATWRKMRHG